MAEYLLKADAYDFGTLVDWYIHSVMDDPPYWTEDHLDELLKDFYVIPKCAPTLEIINCAECQSFRRKPNQSNTLPFECGLCVHQGVRETYSHGFCDQGKIPDDSQTVHAHWIVGMDGSYMCSHCWKVERYDIGDRCNHCGARMMGGEF